MSYFVVLQFSKLKKINKLDLLFNPIQSFCILALKRTRFGKIASFLSPSAWHFLRRDYVKLMNRPSTPIAFTKIFRVVDVTPARLGEPGNHCLEASLRPLVSTVAK